jgi:RNA polymerase sigma factor (sigma-70 family)
LFRKVIGELFEENHIAFKHYLKRRFSELNDYDVEDIIQHTLLKLLYRGDDILSINNITSYMYTSLQNGAKDYFRKHNRIVLPGNDDKVFEQTSQIVEEYIINAELKEVIKQAILSLDAKSRYVFVETEVMGRSYSSLVSESGEKLGTLLSRKNRAKKYLQEVLSTYMRR